MVQEKDALTNIKCNDIQKNIKSAQVGANDLAIILAFRGRG